MKDINEKEKRNIQNEIQLLKTLKHPNIVIYIDQFMDDKENINIVMKFCEGGDLYKRIRNNEKKRFPEKVVLNWMA